MGAHDFEPSIAYSCKPQPSSIELNLSMREDDTVLLVFNSTVTNLKEDIDWNNLTGIVVNGNKFVRE